MTRQDPVIARVKLEELIARYPDEKDGRTWLWRLTQGEERRRLLEEALELDPFNGAALNELAYYLAREGNFAAADSLAAIYVEQQPHEPNPRDSQGEIFEAAENYAAARRSYEKALELDPGFYLSLDHLVRAYLREDLAPEAREALRPFTTHSIAETRVEALLLTADTYVWQGDFEEAFASLDEAVAFAAASVRPDLESRVLATGFIPLAIHTHRFERSEPAFARLRDIDPFNPRIGVYAIQTLGELGRLEEMAGVRDAIARALADNPQSRPWLGLLLPTLDATVAYYRGDLEQAVATPGLAESVTALANTGTFVYPDLRPLVDLERGEEALKVAVQMEHSKTRIGPGLNRLDPVDYHVALYYQGRSYELLADTARAIEAYRTVVDHWGISLEQVPEVADAAERLEALRPE
jgi:tetratricopeptide (TPR) repeat protein